MKYFMVTVRLPKNPTHNPRMKKTGQCPINKHKTCTDITGEHHTMVIKADDMEAAIVKVGLITTHITRIEEM